METDKIYAPVIIPTLCRFEHFKRCIESLQRNSYAKYTELYIGLDYPLKPEHEEGHAQISEYLDAGIEGFREVHVIRHSSNMGARENGAILIEMVYATYDRYIYSEDDNEFAPNYLEYMNKCLWKYADDESVYAISGFNYPMEENDSGGNVYFNNVFFSAFGYGIWKSSIEYREQYYKIELFEDKFQDRKFTKQLCRRSSRQYSNFVKGMLRYTTDLIQEEHLRKADCGYGLFMYMMGKKMVYPVKSKVRNWGYDGTGVNCSKQKFNPKKKSSYSNFGTECQKLDDSVLVTSIDEVDDSIQTELNSNVNEFFDISQNELLRTDIAYIFSIIFGLKMARKFVRALNNLRKR